MMRRFIIAIVTILVSLVVVSPVVAQEPVLGVTGPEDGDVIEGMSVTVEFEIEGIEIIPSDVPLEEAGQRPEANVEGEGHLHLLLDLQPMVILGYDDPYTFNDVPPGEHELMVEIVQNDHSSFDPPVMEHIQFRTEAMQVLPATGTLPTTPAAIIASLVIMAVATLSAGIIVLRRTPSPVKIVAPRIKSRRR